MNFLKSVSVFHTIVLLFSILPVAAQNNEDKFKPKTSKESAKLEGYLVKLTNITLLKTKSKKRSS